MQNVSRLINTFIPNHYNLSLTIDRTAKTFHGLVDINGAVSDAGEIRLHSKGLAIESVLVDGKAALFSERDDDELVITSDSLTLSDHLITVSFSGNITDGMHGMYPCYFEHGGVKKELIATQFESHHAREVFPCIDEPEAKATFDVTLTTEPGVTVLGNMPVNFQREEDGKLVTKFDTTPRMSSYLLAWVYGELQSKSAQTKSGVEVNVWSTPAQSLDGLDFALDHAVKTIEFFNEYFGIDYPLPKSDHVALPDFSSGAMENWGLITYRETALIADPHTSTVDGRRLIATVIAHELSHQWFGNLVTMKWWDNLWLNESFANLMEYIAVDALHPEWNIWLHFSQYESVLALRRDSIDGIQPVQMPVHHPDEISTIFDAAIVYAKGSRLMRMAQDFIGHDAFRRGLSSYFKEFAYKNTEADDLWQHLSAASGEDIAHMMNIWISQSGYPLLKVYPDHLEQAQFFIGPHQASDKLWPIPLGAESDEDVPRLLETRTLRLPIADDERFNIRDSAHFITHYQPEHLARLLDKHTTFDELGRLQLLHEQTLITRAGILPSVELFTLLHAYRDETTDSVWDIIALTLGELRKFVESDDQAENALRRYTATLAHPLYDKLGWEAAADDDDATIRLRNTILGLTVYGEADDALEICTQLYARGLEAIDPEQRSLVISSVVRRSTEKSIIEELMNLYATTPLVDLRDDICTGLTSARQPDQIDYILSMFTDKSVIRPQDLARWFVYLTRNRHARTRTWQWMTSHWDWIDQTFSGDKSYDEFPRYAAYGPHTHEELGAYKDFFEPLTDNPTLSRNILLGIREIEGRLELLDRDGDAVRQKLLRS